MMARDIEISETELVTERGPERIAIMERKNE